MNDPGLASYFRQQRWIQAEHERRKLVSSEKDFWDAVIVSTCMALAMLIVGMAWLCSK